MGATFYFDDPIYPVDEATGLADLKATPTQFEVLNSNAYGHHHQVYLQMTTGDQVTRFHLTKIQAKEIADAIQEAQSRIAYDNTTPFDERDKEE